MTKELAFTITCLIAIAGLCAISFHAGADFQKSADAKAAAKEADRQARADAQAVEDARDISNEIDQGLQSNAHKTYNAVTGAKARLHALKPPVVAPAPQCGPSAYVISVEGAMPEGCGVMGKLSAKLRNIENGGIGFWCPGCKEMHVVHVGQGDGPRWGYNGNPDSLTFTPSVLVQGTRWEPPVTPENLDEWKRAPWPQTKIDDVCHSFVTDGQIQFLGDCTHELIGQVVPIPDLDEGDVA